MALVEENININDYNLNLIKKNKGIIISLVIGLFAIVIYFIIVKENKCDLTDPNNRDFNVYFGINQISNPFGITNAEKQDVNFFFEQALTESMKSSPSFIMFGECGSGKTQIRNYKLSKYDKNENIFIKFLGNQISHYLQNFVSNINLETFNHVKIEKHFKKKDFLDIILSEICQNIILLSNDYNNLNALKRLGLDEKIKISYLLSIYNTNALDSIISLLKKLLPDHLNRWFSEIDLQNCKKNNFNQKHYLPEIIDNLSKIRILSHEQKQKNGLLTYCIYEKVLESPLDLIREGEFKKINRLSNMLRKTLNKNLIIIVDSLDENSFFFKNEDGSVYIKAIQTFVDAITSPDVLSLALGNNDDRIFDILIFLPYFKEIDVKWTRIDKIPIIHHKWDLKKLSNYLDFVLNYYKKNYNGGCKPMPTIENLINYPKFEKNILSELRHPRDLHIYMNELINIMNTNAKYSKFIASENDVFEALEAAKKKFLKNDNFQ